MGQQPLKVKLMLRRPINQLVAQGILPPLKTPPAFHEQRQKLERAKMGDLLKAKIQQRPDRQELVRQHILEDVGHVDPSLAERQRMLKKCKLADTLNDQLSHRPGPLELIKKNILHTEEPIERAVKEGHIEFKATCEGQKTKPQHPDHYMTLDDDSQSSEATSPPRLSPPHDLETMLNDLQQEARDQRTYLPGSRDMLETAAAQAGIVTVMVAPGTILATAPSPSLSLSSLSPLSSVSSPPSTSPSTSASRTPQHQHSSGGKDKNRKKSKSKTQLKTRTIKFHEYKGPPSAHKNSSQNAPNSAETSYELLLQQQQLFLQWQLEWQHKYPQIILPATQKSQDQTQNLITVTAASPASITTSVQSPPPPPSPDTRPLRNLEDMKVSDLKAELKKRNLPVSGAKPQLIERLRPFSNCNMPVPSPQTDTDSLLSVCNLSPAQTLDPDSPPPSAPTSPSSDLSPQQSEPTEDIIREQKKRIEELQRQLLRSQLQLQHQSTFQPQQTVNAKANLAAFLQQQQLNQLLLQQQQLQQLQQQQRPQQLIGIISSTPNNNNINNNSTSHKQPVVRTQTQPLLLNQINLKTNGNNQRTSSLPNFVGTFVPAHTIVAEPIIQMPLPAEVTEDKQDQNCLQSHPPPLYQDATKLLRVKQEVDDIQDVKSQIVDDVLDILIKNGELPPSAAQDPYPGTLDLRDLGLDMEGDTDAMDLSDQLNCSELMDVDPDWLDNLMDPPLPSPNVCDTDALDPFDFNIDDTDFRMADFGWDRVDFAT